MSAFRTVQERRGRPARWSGRLRKPTRSARRTRSSLAERYKEMAHEGHEHRGVDTALRALDLGIAGGALIVLSPVLGAIALSIRLTSGLAGALPRQARGPRRAASSRC